MKRAIPVLVVAAGVLAACADYYPPPPPPPSGPPPLASAEPAPDGCFLTRDLRDHRVGDPSTLYVATGVREIFKLEMVGACLSGVGPSDPLVIRPSGGSPYVCRPIDLDVSIARGGPGGVRTPCIVQSMTRLTPEQVEALPARLRP